LIAFLVRHGVEPMPLDIMSTSVLAAVLGINALSIAGVYGAKLQDDLLAQSWRAVQAWTVVFIILMAIGYLTKTSTDYSRLWAVIWYSSSALGLIAVRAALVVRLTRLRNAGYLATTIAIVDLGDRGNTLARQLTRNNANDVRLVGVFAKDDEARPGKGIADLIALSRLFRIDEVLVLARERGNHPDDLASALRRLGTIPTNVRLCPVSPDLDQVPIRDTCLVHDIPVLTVHRRPIGTWSSVAKRIEDVVIGGIALVLLSPVMLLVAILIKLDSRGPVLFRQARQGFNNNVITVLKFRSMTHTTSAPSGQVVQATRDDRRITRVGRILRRTSIDELPQILNVLRGEMSLVGPRPHAVVHNMEYAELIDDYLGRHRMQPGITGWAQVNGWRGETDTLDKMQRRVEYDLFYIDNWSIALDLKIIVLTAISILFDRKAY
jgi:Undecaprenyl-phosphate glucose phosphotransferase